MSEREKNEVKNSIMEQIESMDEEELRKVLGFLSEGKDQREQGQEVE